MDTKKWNYRIAVGITSGKPEVFGPFAETDGFNIFDSEIFGDHRFIGTNYRWAGPLQTIEIPAITATKQEETS